MSNNKQTAVEWLIEQFAKYYAIHQLDEEIEQAKQMEKEEMLDFAQKIQPNIPKHFLESIYNETYGKTKNRV